MNEKTKEHKTRAEMTEEERREVDSVQAVLNSSIRHGVENGESPVYIVETDDQDTKTKLVLGGVSTESVFNLETLQEDFRKNRNGMLSSPTRQPNEKDAPVIIVHRQKPRDAVLLYNQLRKVNVTVYLQDANFELEPIRPSLDREGTERRLKEQYKKHHSASSNVSDFEDYLEQTRNEPPVPTGFKTLDDLLDGGLYPGLYSVGAETSLGKTTFCLNIAVNISERNRDVLFFSMEMNKTELIGKMLSRETYIMSNVSQGKGHPQTERTLTNYSRMENLQETDLKLIDQAKQLFQAKSKNLYLFESIGELTVQGINQALQGHLAYSGTQVPPVIIIDYLQILRHEDKYINGNDKLKTDTNIFLLKKIANKYRVPIILVSSLNRDAYSKPRPITQTSFKESGAIEFTSDVIIGLQFDGVESPEFNEEQAKSQNPREIDLVILKNRHGQRNKHVKLRYNTWFNYFEETTFYDDSSNVLDLNL